MRCLDLMEVSIGLTDLGEREYLHVIKTLFSFINKIRGEGI
jgi:secreted Zn-dependent insulinase-like peptidase